MVKVVIEEDGKHMHTLEADCVLVATNIGTGGDGSHGGYAIAGVRHLIQLSLLNELVVQSIQDILTSTLKNEFLSKDPDISADELETKIRETMEDFKNRAHRAFNYTPAPSPAELLN